MSERTIGRYEIIQELGRGGMDGRSRWTFATKRPVSAAPLILYDTIYRTSQDHHVYELQMESGEEHWRLELKRRIEAPPVIGGSALLVADTGGTVIALAPPPIPDALLAPHAAHRSSTYLKQLRQEAESREAQNQPLLAARLWHELGELGRAGQQYEVAGEWLKAARLWLQLDRYGKRARALEKHALAIDKEDIDDEKKAMAWEKAAQAYIETGQTEERIRSEYQVALYRQQPILSIEIEAEDMVLNAWARVHFTVHNSGFGVARRLHVRLKDDRFEGQAARTLTVISLPPARRYAHWLDVSPRAHGPSVPMQLIVEYADKDDTIHSLEQTFYVPVASDAPQAPTKTQVIPDQVASVDTGELFSTLPAAGEHNLFELRGKLVQNSSKDELSDIIFEMGLLEDEFDTRLSIMAKELVVHLARNGRIGDLIAICRTRRPHIQW